MNTAQISIKLVLAGILALCAFVLPLWSGKNLSTDLLQSEALIGILGLAYLVGVIFDKLADTILTPMEDFLRLKQAGKFLDDNTNFKGKDPFPQNDLEYSLKKADDGRLEWMNSLKSRIRTSRELAVLGLPATMGVILYLGTAGNWKYIPIALNLLLFIVTAWLESNISDEDSRSHGVQKKRLKTRDVLKDEAARKKQLQLAGKHAQQASIPYYLLMAISTIGIGIAAALDPGNTLSLTIGAGGLIISLLALWACLRITRTYLKFVAREMTTHLKGKEK